jgi:SAM-dependent methyltransferase
VTDIDDLEMLREEFWDDRYASRPQIWSGNPNPHLVARITGVTPGRAVDIGSGEGADAIWLAGQGWTVTATDVSTVALQRGAAHAAAAGEELAARITWRQEDILTWGPEPEAYDLVSSHFMHLPSGLRAALFTRLAAGVAPGGTLLVVGHHPASLPHAAPRGHADKLFTAEEVVAVLDPAAWEIVVAEAPEREVTHEGEARTVVDAVLQARRT